jgi:antitoxin HicB
MIMRYAIRIRKDSNDTFLVTVPDLPDAITFGETLEDAKLQALDAIETAMMARMADREAIPEPKMAGRYYVELRPAVAAKVALWNAMLQQGLGKAALARKLKWHMPQVDRALDVRHESTLGSLVEALSVTGHALSITVTAKKKARITAATAKAA